MKCRIWIAAMMILGSLLIASPLFAQTDHGGGDWTPAHNAVLSGFHYNINTFHVIGGRTVYVGKLTDGSTGSLVVNANNIQIDGTISATGAGYRGGTGGLGGGRQIGGRAGTNGTGTGFGLAGTSAFNGNGYPMGCWFMPLCCMWSGHQCGGGGAGGGSGAGHATVGCPGGRGTRASYTDKCMGGSPGYGTIGGLEYDSPDDYWAMVDPGSGGAGGGGGGGSYYAGNNGGNGGAGGGKVVLQALNLFSMNPNGKIYSDGTPGGIGGNAGPKTTVTWKCCILWGLICWKAYEYYYWPGAGGGAGGGSGGSIVVSGGDVNIQGAGKHFYARGGSGGIGGYGWNDTSLPASPGISSEGSGGDGSTGYVRVFRRPTGSFNCNGNSSVCLNNDATSPFDLNGCNQTAGETLTTEELTANVVDMTTGNPLAATVRVMGFSITGQVGGYPLTVAPGSEIRLEVPNTIQTISGTPYQFRNWRFGSGVESYTDTRPNLIWNSDRETVDAVFVERNVYMWIGDVSEDWDDHRNWQLNAVDDPGAPPSITHNISISDFYSTPACATAYGVATCHAPHIQSSAPVAKSLYLASGATLTFNDGVDAQLTIANDLTVLGNLYGPMTDSGDARLSIGTDLNLLYDIPAGLMVCGLMDVDHLDVEIGRNFYMSNCTVAGGGYWQGGTGGVASATPGTGVTALVGTADSHIQLEDSDYWIDTLIASKTVGSSATIYQDTHLGKNSSIEPTYLGRLEIENATYDQAAHRLTIDETLELGENAYMELMIGERIRLCDTNNGSENLIIRDGGQLKVDGGILQIQPFTLGGAKSWSDDHIQILSGGILQFYNGGELDTNDGVATSGYSLLVEGAGSELELFNASVYLDGRLGVGSDGTFSSDGVNIVYFGMDLNPTSEVTLQLNGLANLNPGTEVHPNGRFAGASPVVNTNLLGDWTIDPGVLVSVLNDNNNVSLYRLTVNGTLLLGGSSTHDSYLNSQSGVSIAATGDFTVGRRGTLVLGDSAGVGDGVDVDVVGTWKVLGVAGQPATVTATTGKYWNAAIRSGANMQAQYGEFSRLYNTGIHFLDGSVLGDEPSTIDYDFEDCRFSDGHPTLPFSYLTLDMDPTLYAAGGQHQIDNAVFESPVLPVPETAVNVTKNTPAGRIKFQNESGDLAGEAYDLDPDDRVDWTMEPATVNYVDNSDTPLNSGWSRVQVSIDRGLLDNNYMYCVKEISTGTDRFLKTDGTFQAAPGGCIWIYLTQAWADWGGANGIEVHAEDGATYQFVVNARHWLTFSETGWSAVRPPLTTLRRHGPPVPTNLTATAVREPAASPPFVRLSWDHVADASYYIAYRGQEKPTDEPTPVGGQGDSFTDNDWTADPAWSSPDGVGSFTVFNGVLRQTNAAASEARLFLLNPTASAYIYEVSVRKDSGTNGVRIPFKWNGIFATWDIGRLNGTDYESTVSGVCSPTTTNFEMNPGIWYNVKVLVTPTHVIGYINDIQAFRTVCDIGGVAGYNGLGIATLNTAASFDNVRYQPLVIPGGATVTLDDRDARDVTGPGPVAFDDPDVIATGPYAIEVGWGAGTDLGTKYYYNVVALDEYGNESNLLNDEGFEWAKPNTYWNPSVATPGIRNLVLDSGSKYSGDYSGSAVLAPPDGSLYLGQQRITTIAPSTWYRFSRFAMTQSYTTGRAYPAMIRLNHTPSVLVYDTNQAINAAEMDWKYFSAAFQERVPPASMDLFGYVENGPEMILSFDKQRLDRLVEVEVTAGYFMMNIQTKAPGTDPCVEANWNLMGGNWDFDGSPWEDSPIGVNTSREYRIRPCDAASPANCGEWQAARTCTAVGQCTGVPGQTCSAGFCDYAGCEPGIRRFSLANTPPQPLVDYADPTATDTLLVDWNVATPYNPISVQYLIQAHWATTAADCATSTNEAYVQAGGNLGLATHWSVLTGYNPSDTDYARKAVNGLSSLPFFCFRIKARNGDNIETPWSDWASPRQPPSASTVTSLKVAKGVKSSDYTGTLLEPPPMVKVDGADVQEVRMTITDDNGAEDIQSVYLRISEGGFNVTTPHFRNNYGYLEWDDTDGFRTLAAGYGNPYVVFDRAGSSVSKVGNTMTIVFKWSMSPNTLVEPKGDLQDNGFSIRVYDKGGVISDWDGNSFADSTTQLFHTSVLASNPDAFSPVDDTWTNDATPLLQARGLHDPNRRANSFHDPAELNDKTLYKFTITDGANCTGTTVEESTWIEANDGIPAWAQFTGGSILGANIPDGLYSWCAFATDQHYYGATQWVTPHGAAYDLGIDTVKPLLGPVTAYTSNGGNVVPSATWTGDTTPYFDWDPATDPASVVPVSPISGYWWTLAGAPTDPCGVGTNTTATEKEYTVAVTKGKYYFCVQAEDEAGNCSDRSCIEYWQDEPPLPPVITSTTHPDPVVYCNIQDTGVFLEETYEPVFHIGDPLGGPPMSGIQAWSYTIFKDNGSDVDECDDGSCLEETSAAGAPACDGTTCTDSNQPTATAYGDITFHHWVIDQEDAELKRDIRFFISNGTDDQPGTYYFCAKLLNGANEWSPQACDKIDLCQCEKECNKRGGAAGAMAEFRGGSMYMEGATSRMVDVPPFMLDHSEVSNGQYRACVANGACPAPAEDMTESETRENYFSDARYTHYPMVNATHEMAEAFCAWSERRLPTELEWEFAARQTMAQSGNLTMNQRIPNELHEFGDTVPHYENHGPANSEQGVINLFNNVSEWVQDRYADLDEVNFAETPNGPEKDYSCLNRCVATSTVTDKGFVNFHKGQDSLSARKELSTAKHQVEDSILAPKSSDMVLLEQACEVRCDRRVIRGSSFLDEDIVGSYRQGVSANSGDTFIGFRCAESVETEGTAGLKIDENKLLNANQFGQLVPNRD